MILFLLTVNSYCPLAVSSPWHSLHHSLWSSAGENVELISLLYCDDMSQILLPNMVHFMQFFIIISTKNINKKYSEKQNILNDNSAGQCIQLFWLSTDSCFYTTGHCNCCYFLCGLSVLDLTEWRHFLRAHSSRVVMTGLFLETRVILISALDADHVLRILCTSGTQNNLRDLHLYFSSLGCIMTTRKWAWPKHEHTTGSGP